MLAIAFVGLSFDVADGPAQAVSDPTKAATGTANAAPNELYPVGGDTGDSQLVASAAPEISPTAAAVQAASPRSTPVPAEGVMGKFTSWLRSRNR